MAIERILTGVDGSDDSRRALEWAGALAAGLDAELVAVHALGLLEHLDTDKTVPAGAHRDEVVRRFEDEWCAPLGQIEGLRCRRVVEDGPPAMVLLRLARSEQADLIVVGTRGIGGFDELLLGSTSAHLVQHSSVPVTVIPRSLS